MSDAGTPDMFRALKENRSIRVFPQDENGELVSFY
jgi:hypothetical protein